jgi:hypothetical protein
MDWVMLAWSVGASALFATLGWFALESLELYLPRLAAGALAYIFGLGFAGVAYEWLAMAHLLDRPRILIATGALLAGFTRDRAPNTST